MRSSSRAYAATIALVLFLISRFYLFSYSFVGTIIGIIVFVTAAVAAGYAIFGGRRRRQPSDR